MTAPKAKLEAEIRKIADDCGLFVPEGSEDFATLILSALHKAVMVKLPSKFPARIINVTDADGKIIDKVKALSPDKQGYNQALADTRHALNRLFKGRE